MNQWYAVAAPTPCDLLLATPSKMRNCGCECQAFHDAQSANPSRPLTGSVAPPQQRPALLDAAQPAARRGSESTEQQRDPSQQTDPNPYLPALFPSYDRKASPYQTLNSLRPNLNNAVCLVQRIKRIKQRRCGWCPYWLPGTWCKGSSRPIGGGKQYSDFNCFSCLYLFMVLRGTWSTGSSRHASLCHGTSIDSTRIRVEQSVIEEKSVIRSNPW